jgi:hypothetical protein
MTTDLINPLQDVINQALKSKASGPAAKLQQRFANAGSDVVALCDVSGSMWDIVGRTGICKFDHLVAALKDVVVGFPQLAMVAFASRGVKATLADFELEMQQKHTQLRSGAFGHVPAPFDYLGGGTDMGGAIEFVAGNWKPRKTIIITDGQAQDPNHALQAVDLLTGSVDTIYCGADADPAVDFLRKLSRAGVGTHVSWDGAVELAPVLRRLALPAPKGPIVL